MDSEKKSLLGADNEATKPKPKPLSQEQRDMKNMNLFFSPMLDDLEKAVAESMKEMDKIEEEFLADSRREQASRLVAHIPEEIRQRKSIESIMKSLESMIIDTEVALKKSVPIDSNQKKTHEFLVSKLKANQIEITPLNKTKNNDENEKEPSDDYSTFKMGKLNGITCLAHSLTAYLITTNSKKNGEQLKNLTIKLYDSVNLWLSRLFRFYSSSILFHDQESEGLTRMCNLLLNYKYNEYHKNGYQIIKRQPSIYISASSKYATLEYRELITIQLGLPLTSIKLVKVSKSLDDSLDKIDLASFVAQLDEDIKNGFEPLLVVANAGTHNIGQCDDIQQLNEICTRYKIWTHLEGVYLTTLVLYSVPSAVQPVSSGDSITINLATWLGVPSLSYVTLYKNAKNSGLFIKPFNSFLTILQKCLPYWCVLQALGHDGVLNRIKYATDISLYVRDILKKHSPYLKILNFKDNSKPDTKIDKYSFQDLVAKALSFLTYVELNNPVVLFKCDKKYIRERIFLYGSDNPPAQTVEKKQTKIKPEDEFLELIHDNYDPFPSESKNPKKDENTQVSQFPIDSEEITDYTDTLTTWLYDLLNSLHKNIEFELIEIENEGICVRYSPLDHANIYGTNEQDLVFLSKSLEDIMTILESSIKCKSIFDREIKQFKNLSSVYVPKWAGIGAVRYIPDYLLDKIDDITEYWQNKTKSENDSESEYPSMIENNTDLSASTENDNISVNTTSSVAVDTKVDLVDQEKVDDRETTPVVNQEEQFKVQEQKVDKEDSFKENDLLERYLKEINEINHQLATTLQAQDGAFSIGLASDGMLAVKFGMVNETDALRKLALEVQEVGKKVEESTRYIETMSEIIRSGIEKVNEDLKKENDQKIVQQGILRQLPIVGGLFNWIVPNQPPAITGRSFNLQSGKIASTEVIYKYHMQVDETNTETVNNDQQELPIKEEDQKIKTDNQPSEEINQRRSSKSSIHSNVSLKELIGGEPDSTNKSKETTNTDKPDEERIEK